MTHDPFSEHAANRYDTIANPVKKNGGNRLLLALGIGTAALVLICGGLIIAVFFAYQGIAGGDGRVDLRPRPSSPRGSFQSDTAQFNESLAALPDANTVDDSIISFVRECVEADRVDDPIPFDRDMFVQAIGTSPAGSGSLGLVDRIAVRQWLEEYEPFPNKFDKYFRIIGVRWEAAASLATVDLMFYSEDSQADSQQWFLVRNESVWKVYDWQSLEHGRRMSDEYATYIEGSVRLAPGYDLAISQLAEAQGLWDQGKQELAIAKLKASERVPMIEDDRSVALLRTAYMWMSWGRNEDAIDTLKRIKDPDQMWGVWPILSICYLHSDQRDLAMQAALKSQAQAPEHPRTHWLLATIYADFDREDEAAKEAVLALRGCPQDQTLIEMVTQFRRPEDIPALLNAIALGDAKGWVSLADSLAYDTQWADAIIASISATKDIQSPSGMNALLEANQAWSKREYDRAAERFVIARDEADDALIRDVAIEDHVDARIENDRYAELFNETDDLAKTLQTLTEWAYTGDFYGDVRLLLEAIDFEGVSNRMAASESASAWSKGLAGWCRHQLGDDDVALSLITKFSDWRNRDIESPVDDESWLQEWIDQAIVECLLGTRQYVEVVDRFPESNSIQSQLVSHLIQQEPSQLQSFRESTAESNRLSVRLIHARLNAAMATRKGEVRLADEFHREALEFANEVDADNESSLRSVLLRQRAKDIVISRVIPNEIEIADDHIVEFVNEVIAEAARLGDSKSLKAWGGRLASIDADPQIFAGIQTRLAEQRFASGRFDEAAELLGASLASRDFGAGVFENGNREDIWLQRQKSLRLQSLLEASRFDEALRERGTAEPIDSSGNPTKQSLFRDEVLSIPALVALARGDAESLAQLVSGLDRKEVANWLGESLQRRWLVRYADDPAYQRIIERYPLAIGYLSPEASGNLLMPAGKVISPETIRSDLQTQFDETFQIEPIIGRPGNASDSAWIATSQSGNRILVGWSIQSFLGARYPSLLQSAVNDPVGQLTIAVLDQEPKANERLFQIASAFADDQTFAFSWNDEFLTWYGADLKSRLPWLDRAPIQASTMPQALVHVEKDSDSDEGVMSIQQWSERFKAGDSSIPAVAYQSCAGISEAINCEVTQAIVENHNLIVRVIENSKCDPLIQAGMSYTVYSGNVRTR